MYDYVIVGAGSAGCVLAARLTEDPQTRVCLLEAGPPDRDPKIHMPAGFAQLVESAVNWSFDTVPQRHCDGRTLFQPRGRTLGGSSSINAQLYIRGHRLDYDLWRQMGNRGWGHDDVLPYFRKAEGNVRGADRLHGADGPLGVAEQAGPLDLSARFVRACAETGIPANADFNGEEQEGAGLYQVTQRRARRCSTAVAYLRPAMRRPNLTVMTGAQAVRILVERGRAVGVAYVRGRAAQEVRAAREVLLCAGAFQSPQLLLLSGIGPADEIAAHGIAVCHDLPGVGRNLQDHVNVDVYRTAVAAETYDGLTRPWPMLRTALQYYTRRRGPGASVLAEGGAFLRTDPALAAPDVQFHFIPAIVIDHGRVKHPGRGVSLHVCALRPESRGQVRLASADPLAPPAIDPNYLAERADLDTLVRGLRKAQAVLAAPAFAGLLGEEFDPGPDRSDAELQAYCRRTAETIYHPVGTCRMGSDDQAVVDDELRLRGLDGLRVVDASVMPAIVGGNTNAPVIMIAEKAADLIRGRVAAPAAA
ncbi:MAG: choline dehydrogenase [Sneathiellaceae bacterium]